MVQVAYPLEFPLDEIQDCIRIVTGKTILEEKQLFAAAAWNVQGFAQKMLLGSPYPLPPGVQEPGVSPSNHDDLQKLRLALMTVDPAGDASQSLPAWLMLLVEILIKILSELGE